MSFKALMHILVSARQTEWLCVAVKHINRTMSVRIENLRDISVLILLGRGLGTQSELISGNGVDRGMLSFNRNCYLQTIQLVNRSMSTLAHSFVISLFKKKTLSQQHTQCTQHMHRTDTMVT